jgi:hypothetical protein
LSNMTTTANLLFSPLTGTFTANTANCSGGYGLVGSYAATVVLLFNVTVQAQSCYPIIPPP